jgi:hypothetical protein
VPARLTDLRAVRRPVGATLLRLGAAPRLLAAATLLRWALAGLVLLATGGLTAVLGAAMLS